MPFWHPLSDCTSPYKIPKPQLIKHFNCSISFIHNISTAFQIYCTSLVPKQTCFWSNLLNIPVFNLSFWQIEVWIIHTCIDVPNEPYNCRYSKPITPFYCNWIHLWPFYWTPKSSESSSFNLNQTLTSDISNQPYIIFFSYPRIFKAQSYNHNCKIT